MIEIPESLTLAQQLNETVEGREITVSPPLMPVSWRGRESAAAQGSEAWWK